MQINIIENHKQIIINKDSSNIADLSSFSNEYIFNYIVKSSIKKINYYWLGRRDYLETWELQKKIQREVINDNINNVILFLEHNPVYTIGRNADDSNLLPTKSKSLRIIKTDRGGDVTCHAPGQLIGYPIIDLKKYKKSITWFVRGIEDSIIKMLNKINIDSTTKEGLTGVWVNDEKIAALGIRLSKWVSMHGFALNVSTDLQLFRGIVPCGITEFGLTSIYKIKEKKYTTFEIAQLMAASLTEMLISSKPRELDNVKA